jgi:hypothetical protein
MYEAMSIWFLLRGLFGALVGALPGMALAAMGVRPQGDGIAVIGASIGTMLALSRALYRQTFLQAIERGFTLFLRLTVTRMAPGIELLVQSEEQAGFENPSVVVGLRAKVDQRMLWGAIIGMVVLAAPISILSWNIPLSKGEANHPPALRALVRVFIFTAATVLLGGGVGATCGALTMSGMHRRDILLGTVCGALIGTGLAIAVEPGAKIPPRDLYLAFGGVAAYLGMMCGFVSGVASYFGRNEELG